MSATQTFDLDYSLKALGKSDLQQFKHAEKDMKFAIRPAQSANVFNNMTT